MGNALITLSIGLTEAERASHDLFRAYADKYGMAFEVISRPRYRIRPNWFRKRWVWCQIEKFQLYEALGRYERVLFLDSDILLDASCPDLTGLVPSGSLGCAYDDEGADAWKREVELRKLQRRLGSLGEGPWRYFNSGVMILDASHRSLFEMDRKAFIRGRWPEQTLLNYRVIRQGIPVHRLEPRFNFFPTGNNNWEDADVRHAAPVVHYAGRAAKASMAADLPFKRKGWGLS